jgi:tetratricopeptide (TPR) repeat protein
MANFVPLNADRPVKTQFRQAIDEIELARSQGESPTLGQALGGLGMLYQAYGYPEPAHDRYLDAMQLDPADARWPYYLAHTERALGNYAAAAVLFATTLEQLPASSAAQVWLAESNLDGNQLDDAERGFNKAMLMDPGCNRALAGLGRVALERGDNDLAINYLTRAVQTQPQVASLHYQLAMAYRANNEATSANGYMQNASRLQTSAEQLRLDDPMLDAISTLPVGHESIQMDALRALLDKDYKEAVRLYRQALTIKPGNSDNRYNLALALMSLGQTDEALSELQQGLKQHPDDVDSHLLAARLYAEKQQLDMIEEHLLMANRADPQHVEVQLRLGNFYRLSNRLSVAEHHYDEVMRLDDGNADAYIGKAMVLIERDDYDQAMNVLTTGLRRNPDNPRLHDAQASLQNHIQNNQ